MTVRHLSTQFCRQLACQTLPAGRCMLRYVNVVSVIVDTLCASCQTRHAHSKCRRKYQRLALQGSHQSTVVTLKARL